MNNPHAPHFGPQNSYVHPDLGYFVTDVEMDDKQYRGASMLVDLMVDECQKGEWAVGFVWYDEEDAQSRPVRFLRKIILIKPDGSDAEEWRYDVLKNQLRMVKVDAAATYASQGRQAVSSPYEEADLLRHDRQQQQRRSGLMIELMDIPTTNTEDIFAMCTVIWPGRKVTVEDGIVKVGKFDYTRALELELRDTSTEYDERRAPAEKKETGTEFFARMVKELDALMEDPSKTPIEKMNIATQWMQKSKEVVMDSNNTASLEERKALLDQADDILDELEIAIMALTAIAKIPPKEPCLISYMGYPRLAESVPDPAFPIAVHPDEYRDMAPQLELNQHVIFSHGEQVLVDWFLDMATDAEFQVRHDMMETYVTGDFVFKKLNAIGYPVTEAMYPVYAADPVEMAKGNIPVEDRALVTGVAEWEPINAS